MARVFTFGDKVVTDDSPSFVIAEIGHNHQGDIEKCKAIFKAAAECGADAVKIQKRDNRALFTREMYDSTTRARTPMRRLTARTARSWSSARDAVSRTEERTATNSASSSSRPRSTSPPPICSQRSICRRTRSHRAT